MPTALQLALRQDRDRESLQATGAAAAGRFGVAARLAAISAWNATGNPTYTAQAAARSLLGADGQGELLDLLTKGMLAGHLSGVRRVGINLQETGALNRQLRLSSAYDVAIGFLKKRASLATGHVTGLLKRYGQAALGGLGKLVDSLANRISGTLSETVAAGAGVDDGVKALRDAFTAEGLVPGANHALENLFRTQTQLAYSAGRLSALAAPAVDRILWGYTYVTVGDDRVRPAHAAMDGVTRPKDDPVWRIWQPPCGYNCRCSTLELFDKGTSTKDLPAVQPDPGFAFNPLDLVRDVGSTPPKRAA